MMKKMSLSLLSALFFTACGQAGSAKEAREIESSLLVPTEGWEVEQSDHQVLKEKYSEVILRFQNTNQMIPLMKALEFLENNLSRIPNKNYLTLIDYSQHASVRRFYLIDLRTGKYSKYNVSNGRGSDRDYDGFAESFSNENESFQTSLGFYLTLDAYFSVKFKSQALRLNGLSKTNSNAYDRAIVIHGADYMQPEKGLFGRSLGCPALDIEVASEVISKMKDGSLIFAYK